MKRNIPIFIGVLVIAGIIATSGIGLGKVTKYYGILAGSSLYICLLAGLVLKISERIKTMKLFLNLPRIFGLMALEFGLLHGGLAFFGQFGGFGGIGFLPTAYLWPIGIGFSLLVCMLAVTLFKKARPIVYILGTMVVFHMMMIGSDFVNLHSNGAQFAFVAFMVLLILESIVLDEMLKKRFVNSFRCGLFLPTALFLAGIFTTHFFAGNGTNALSLHGQHAAMMTDTSGGMNMAMPVVSNARRFTVSFLHPDVVVPGKNVPLRFEIYDAGTGNKVTLFSTAYDKLMHMIVVDESLGYFTHIHPAFDSNKGFVIDTVFPHSGMYHVYVDFMPLGEKIEQQFGFSIQVGNGSTAKIEEFVPSQTKKIFHGYEIAWSSSQTLSAAKMSTGQQPMTFHIQKDGQNFTDIRPYLAAFGHLTMVNTKSFAFVHVHPKQAQRLTAESRSGPDVEFLPMSYYSKIEPGTYRMFGEFNLAGKIVTTNFDIDIQP